MTSPSVVRAAVPADKPEIWRLFRLLHQENGLSSLSEPKVDAFIDRLIDPRNIAANDNGPRGLIGVIGKVGALEGVIMLTFGSQWYSDDITLDECLNFVDPAHRASFHAKTLIAYAKHMTDEIRTSQPSVRLVIGVLSTKRTAAKVRLYERERLTPSGSFFVYPPLDEIAPPNTVYRTRGNGR